MEEKTNEVTTRAQEICQEIRRLTEELERQTQEERERLIRAAGQGNRLQLVVTPRSLQEPHLLPPAGRPGTKIDAGIIDWVRRLRRNW